MKRELKVRAILGRTRAGRLRGLDQVVVEMEGALLGEEGGLFVDVGYGESGVTTVEALEQFHCINKSLRAIGVEVDAQRVERAQRQTTAQISFKYCKDFDLSGVLGGEKARLVRAMNVLRQYGPEEAEKARDVWGLSALVEGGLLVEGTSDPGGGLLTAHWLRRRGGSLVKEGLLMMASGERGFAPRQMRDWLPTGLRRGGFGGSEVEEVLEVWGDTWREVRAEMEGGFASKMRAKASMRHIGDWGRVLYEESAQRLAQRRADVRWVAIEGGGGVFWRTKG